MIEVGRLVVKIAGRDAGNTAVVVDRIDDNYVLIDGGARRKKCNIRHLEPLDKSIDISKGASHELVAKEFEKLGIEVWKTKAKAKKGVKPIRLKKSNKTEAVKSEAKESKEKRIKKKE